MVSSIPWATWDQIERCLNNAGRHCGLGFSTYLLNPVTMRSRIIYHHNGSAPFGGATIAVERGEYLYFGSFAGNRMARVRPVAGLHPNN